MSVVVAWPALQEFILAQMNALNYVAAIVEHLADVLCVDGTSKMSIE